MSDGSGKIQFHNNYTPIIHYMHIIIYLVLRSLDLRGKGQEEFHQNFHCRLSTTLKRDDQLRFLHDFVLQHQQVKHDQSKGIPLKKLL